MIKQLLKIFLTITLSLCFALLGFELYLRMQGFLEAQPAAYPCIQGDSTLNHVFQPNCEAKAYAKNLHTDQDVFYRTNEIGIRSEEIQKHREYIVVVGDSYTEGFGLNNEDSFPAQLEKKLKTQPGFKNIQVLNGGTLGYSPALYSKYFKRKFLALKPKHVLLNFDLTDFNEDVYYWQIADYDEQGNPIGFPSREYFSSPIAAFIYQDYSAVLRFLHQEVNLWNLSQLREKKLVYLRRRAEAASKLIDDAWLKKYHQPPHCEANYELTAALLLQLKNVVEASGASFSMHVYPPGYLVKQYPNRPQNISFWRTWENKMRKDDSFLCPFPIEALDILKEFAKEQKIPFFDSREIIFKNPKKETLYFSKDAHWNRDGVRVVVDNLAPRFSQRLRQFSVKHGK